MKADKELIALVRAKAKDFRGNRRDEADRDLEDYGIACDLSRGPDASRSKHWTEKARMLERRLRKLVGDQAWSNTVRMT